MKELDKNSVICKHCNNIIKPDDEFCPECGTVLIDGVYCDNHKSVLARGVCIICSIPYCKNCGIRVSNHFLCNDHSDYEIYEGMVRVYGTPDDVTAQFAKSCLEQEGLHPVLFCRRQPFGGGPRFVYSLFEASGDSLGNIVNEIKVMVPCQELIASEAILKSAKIIE